MKFFLESLPLIIACITASASIFISYKTNKAMKAVKTIEYKKTAIYEFLNEASKPTISKSFNYEELICSCYKAMVFVNPSTRELLQNFTVKARLLQSINPLAGSQKLIKKYDQYLEEVNTLIVEIIESMHEEIMKEI